MEAGKDTPFSPRGLSSANNSKNNLNQAISAEQLLEFLADLLLETRPDALNTGPDFHYNVNDAIDILPKLQTGLDVNVRQVTHFMFCCCSFDPFVHTENVLSWHVGGCYFWMEKSTVYF